MTSNGSPRIELTPADRRLLRRASTAVAVQTAIAVMTVIAVIVVLVYSLSRQERHDATVDKLQHKTADMITALRGEVEDAPPGGQQEPTSGGLEIGIDGLPDTPACAAVTDAAPPEPTWADDLPLGETELTLCGTPVLAFAAEQDGFRAVAATSVVEQQEETERLARLSLLAGLIGVVAAAALGWVVARRAVRPLGEALASQRRFVADASHELRTPLAILHTRAQLLQRAAATNGGPNPEADQLVDDARVLTDIVNDLLLSAEMQHRPGTGQRVDLDRVVADIRRSFSGTADAVGVDLVVDSDPGGAHIVTGAPSALRRAIAALVDNALHHVDRGGTITVALDGTPSTVRVRVIDDGTGFDPQVASTLTQRFHRGTGPVGTATATGARLGLGLALVEEVVRAHEGTLDITGARGQGASVTLTFPAATRASSTR